MGNKASKQQAGAQSGDAPQNGPKPSVAGAKGSSGSLFKRGKSEKVYTESVTLVSPRVWAERRPEKPNEHLTDVGRADGVVYAASAIRGDRKYMEDTHSVVLGMEHPRPPPPPPPQPNSNLGGRRRSILSVFTGSSEDGATSPAPSHGRRGSILRFLGSHDSNHDNSTSNPPSHANPLASPSTGSSNDGIAHHPQPRRKSIWQALHMTSMDSVERARSPSAISITLSSQITRPTSRASGHSEHVDAEERTMTPDQTYPQRRASRTRRKSILDVITSPFRRSSTALSERRGSFAPSESELQLPSHFSYFAVFDGHAGKEAAEFCAEKMHDVLTKQLSFARGDYVSAIREGFMAMDGELRSGDLMSFVTPKAGS